jgi:phenylalanyl-tRNA synthetase beta subunit
LKNWRIKMPVSLFEIDLKEIFKKFGWSLICKISECDSEILIN